MLKRYLADAISLGLFATSAAAGEFSVRTIDASLDWKPTQCSKPGKLFFHVTDVDSYNAAVEEYNQYLFEVRKYRECINEEAQVDAKTAAQSISTGLNRANGDLRQEIDAARSDLESAKRLLQKQN